MRSKRTCPACPRGCPSAPSPPPARAGGLEATYPPPHRHQHNFLCFPPHRFPRPHCEGKSCRSSSPSRLHRHPVHLKSLVESCQNLFCLYIRTLSNLEATSPHCRKPQLCQVASRPGKSENCESFCCYFDCFDSSEGALDALY